MYLPPETHTTYVVDQIYADLAGFVAARRRIYQQLAAKADQSSPLFTLAKAYAASSRRQDTGRFKLPQAWFAQHLVHIYTRRVLSCHRFVA